MNINQVWVEKYRPKSIEEMILSEKNREHFSNLTEIPNNLLFVGNPGCGKTTLAKILANKFAPYSYLYINASEEGNIDTVRNKIADFISVMSMDGSQKVVILNEADGVSLVAQQALRSIMEDYLDSVKFILTANYKNKLSEAIRSRCQEFTLEYTDKQVLQRVVQILKLEKISVNPEDKPNLLQLIKEHSPDIRKTLNELQSACITRTFKYSITDYASFAEDIKLELNSGKHVFVIRQKIVDNLDKFGNDYHTLMKNLYNLYIVDQNMIAVLLISEYMFKHSQVLDPEVNFTGLLINLKTKLSK
jgi:DNA polymerase III delta prime subunit